MKLPLLIFLVCLLPVRHSALADDKPSEDPNRIPGEAVEALATGTDYFLYSIDPGPITFHPQPTLKPQENLHGFKLLGGLHLTDPKSRSAAIAAFTDAIRAADFRLGARCFRPRHALRVVAKGKQFDFVICYECHRLRIYKNGVQFGEVGVPGTGEVLTKILTSADIPLPVSAPTK